jgi:hypothetical protein
VKKVSGNVDKKRSKILKAKIIAINKKLAKTKNPEKRAALKAQLKAAKKVAALKKQLKSASPAKKAAIRAKIAKARAALKKATQKVVKVAAKADAKKIA